MILAKNWEDAKTSLLAKIIESGVNCKSRFGSCIVADPTLVVVERCEPLDLEFDYDVCGEKYSGRVAEVFDVAARKLKATPHTRRASIPIWRPKDHLCEHPPAVTEISFLFDGKLHLTAYIRSLDALNYFEHNYDFLATTLAEMCAATGFEAGSIAFLVGAPHVYERDATRAESSAGNAREVYGYTELATHIVDDYISSAWHSALEVIYNNGRRKRTEWEMFSGQEETLFVHRMFIEVKKPEENRLHDKAPFTESYAVEYAHDYVIYAAKLHERVRERILKEGEEYTYAERARYCERDEVKVDQLYEVVEKLKSDRCRRDCYVGISRPWDLLSDDPPCLRGYQFIAPREMRGVFYMRSNDAYGAMHANMFAFSLLTKYVAEIVGVDSYRYYHFALDAHIYGGFVKAVRDILYPESPKFSDFV
ncbi:MAG: thymidylate synthase [Archaeoglobaceae archaeon]